MRVASPEEFQAAIAKLQSRMDELNDEWEKTPASDRYWINEEIDDVSVKISRYSARLKTLLTEVQ